jgi:hypothetical protein
MTESCSGASAGGVGPLLGRMASFMGQPISATSRDAKPAGTGGGRISAGKNWKTKAGSNDRTNVNDHEHQVRVHPALPEYSVVVAAPEAW